MAGFTRVIRIECKDYDVEDVYKDDNRLEKITSKENFKKYKKAKKAKCKYGYKLIDMMYENKEMINKIINVIDLLGLDIEKTRGKYNSKFYSILSRVYNRDFYISKDDYEYINDCIRCYKREVIKKLFSDIFTTSSDITYKVGEVGGDDIPQEKD